MENIRLDKFLSSQLNISRTDAKRLLKQSRVSVNAVVCTKGQTDIRIPDDKIFVDGKEIEYKKYVYIMLNKPQGVVSASFDPSEKTVIDILPEEFLRSGLFPAGRLDKDTTGFVLITDDGAFAHNILSPAHHVTKTYTVTLERTVTPAEEKLFFDGMVISDEHFKPASLRYLYDAPDIKNPVYEIKITEGRYHQIKRMFASTGNRVLKLHRTAIGGLVLPSELKPGESRYITDAELKLISATGTE